MRCDGDLVGRGLQQRGRSPPFILAMVFVRFARLYINRPSWLSAYPLATAPVEPPEIRRARSICAITMLTPGGATRYRARQSGVNLSLNWCSPRKRRPCARIQQPRRVSPCRSKGGVTARGEQPSAETPVPEVDHAGAWEDPLLSHLASVASPLTSRAHGRDRCGATSPRSQPNETTCHAFASSSCVTRRGR
jgi:hypothetical protein